MGKRNWGKYAMNKKGGGIKWFLAKIYIPGYFLISTNMLVLKRYFTFFAETESFDFFIEYLHCREIHDELRSVFFVQKFNWQ